MLTQVIFFLAISSGGVLAFMISKEVRPAEYYPITCMAITLILFLFGICNLLWIGFSGVRTKTWTKTGGHAHGITSKSDKSSKIVFRKGI